MENLPQKYKKSFFQNIFDKIKAIFCRKQITMNQNTVQIDETKQKETTEIKQSFVEQMKVDANYKNPEFEKKEFMKNLEKNPNLLEQFSTDRLEKILQYYIEENNKKRKILNTLKA